MTRAATHLPFSHTLWPALEASALRKGLLVVAGAALLAVSAKIQIPFYPVPLTMQTLVVVLIGAAMGMRLGAATVLLYLAEGAMGLPVFAGPVAGMAYLTGPTAGFLLGFVLAAAAAGYLAERGWDRNPLSTFALMVFAAALIYIPGLLWLGTLFGAETAIAKGLLPFIFGDLLKIALATAILPLVWKFIR